MKRWIAALAISTFATAANANDAEDTFAFIPKREARITDEARGAADEHYRKPDAGKVGERYRRFLAGINREWLVEVHNVHREPLPLDPDPTACRERAEALENAARNQPFSLHLALIQQRCAALLEPKREARFERRVEANFARLVEDPDGSELLGMGVFSTQDVRAFLSILGYEMRHSFYSARGLNEVLLTVIAAVPSGKPGDAVELRRFGFNLLGDEVGAGLDDDRFSNALAQYLRWRDTMLSLVDSPSAQVLLSIVDGESAKTTREDLLRRPLDVATAAAILTLCSADDPCPEHVLEPLLEAAENGDALALMALANERLIGQVRPADVEEGLLFWRAASEVAEEVAPWLIDPQAARQQNAEIRATLRDAAVRGHVAAQAMYLGHLAAGGLANFAGERDRIGRHLDKDLDRVLEALAGKQAGPDRRALKHLADLLINPDMEANAGDCEIARIMADITGRCALWRDRVGFDSLPITMQAAASLALPERQRKAARRRVLAELVMAKRYREVADAWLALAMMEEEKTPGIELLLLQGLRPTQISKAGMLALWTDDTARRIVAAQWDASDAADGVPVHLFRACSDDIHACHALVPILHLLHAHERDQVLLRVSDHDPRAQYSPGAETRARLLLRSSSPEKIRLGLAAFEQLKTPSAFSIADYLMQRCGSSDPTVSDPEKATAWLPSLEPNKSNPGIGETLAICYAASGRMEEAYQALEQAISAMARFNGRSVASYRQRAEHMLSIWRREKRLVGLPWRRSPSLPIYELAVFSALWTGAIDEPRESAEISRVLAQLQSSFDAKRGQGMAVRVEGRPIDGEAWVGTNEVRFDPLFLRETRPDRRSIVDGRRHCLLDAGASGERWFCEQSTVSTDWLDASIDGSVVLGAEYSNDTTDESCGEGCVTLRFQSLPSKELGGNEPTLPLLERVAIDRSFTYREADKLVVANRISDSMINVSSRFQLDVEIADTRMPSRCEAGAKRPEEPTAGTIDLVVSGKRKRNTNDEVVIEITREELEAAGIGSIADASEKAQEPTRPQVQGAATCTFE